MNISLDGPRLKVKRAVLEIDLLERQINRFIAQAQYEIVAAEFNKATGKRVYRLKINGNPRVDPNLGLLCGEICHNLRSALDQLVYQLYLLDPANDPKDQRTQFPILSKAPSRKNGQSFERRTINSDLKGVRKKHRDMIELQQPCKRRQGGANGPLAILSNLNNADKHRMLKELQVPGGMYEYEIKGSNASFRPSPARVLRDGAKLFEFDPSVTVLPGFEPQVSFWDEQLPVVLSLRLIAQKVSSIIEDFNADFP